MNLCNKWWRMCINCGEQVQTRVLSGQYGEYECGECGCKEFTQDYDKVGDPSCVPVEYGGEYERGDSQ